MRGSAPAESGAEPPALLSPLAVAMASSVLHDECIDLLCSCSPEISALVKKLRVVSLAAARLGHRSCHALWGPSHSCKEIVLEAVVGQLRRADNVLVMSFNGDTLQCDDEAVLQAALELKHFLSSPSSMKLRQKNSAFRHRTFGFATMMKLANDGAAIEQSHDGVESDSDHAAVGLRKRRREVVDDEDVVSSSASASISRHSPVPLPGATVMTRPGPAALGALQEALVSLTRAGVGIVIAIHNVARYSVWCDRMVYLLSGLMHDAEESGAGMSLLLTSSTPDLRHTEKRLSSRLTSEMWFVSPPYVTVTAVLDRVLTKASARANGEAQRISQQLRELQQLHKKLSSAVIAGKRRSSRPGAQTAGPHDEAMARSNEIAVDVAELEQSIKEFALIASQCSEWIECFNRMASAVSTASQTKEGKNAHAPPRRIRNASGQPKVVELLGSAGDADTLRHVRAMGNTWSDVLCACRRFLSSQMAFHSSSTSEGRGVGQSQDSYVHSGEVAPLVAATTVVHVAGGTRADLLERCLLVELGYATREMLFLLTFCWIRGETPHTARTLDELVHEMQSALPSSVGIKSIPPSNFRAALTQLTSLAIIDVDHERGHVVSLRRDRYSVKLFLQDVLHPSSGVWEKAGLTLQDRQQLSHLVR